MSDGMSFVVCCHNSARRLAETLGHLARQRNPALADWEVVLVDNASTDGTAETARRVWGIGPAPLRIVEEPRAGLSRARLAGMGAAQYDALTLVDDDNWLSPEWLAVSLEALRTHSSAGAIGGQSFAVCEGLPPAWFPGVASSYAIGEQADEVADVTKSRGYLWGAGLVLRREAWRDLFAAGFEFLLDDRTGTRLRSGGDTEICHGLHLRGWGLRYDSALSFRHFLPKERLLWEYCRKLYRSFGEASVVLDTYLLALREREGQDVAEVEYHWSTRMPEARQRLFREIKYQWKLRRQRAGQAPRRTPRALAEALVRSDEGSPYELSLEYALGRFGGLMRLRRRLTAITAKIRALGDSASVSPRP